MGESPHTGRKNARAPKKPKHCEWCGKELDDRRKKWCDARCKGGDKRRQGRRVREDQAYGPQSLAAANDEILADLKMAFLREYERVGIVGLAAERIGRKRRTIYDWARDDATFRELMLDAKEEATDRLVAEASRRAVDGVHKPILYRGESVTDRQGNPLHETEYSDRLLELLLRANRPGEFGTDRQQIIHSGQVAVAGKGGDVLERLAEYADALSDGDCEKPGAGTAPGPAGGDGTSEPVDSSRA